jgi:rare lipoprotein A
VLGSRYHGIASYYHDSFHGRRTASGEIFRQDELVAAHPSLPFGTLVRVTNVRNGRSVVVRITDRGPHVAGRILDVSRAAAEQLGMIAEGLAEIEITILELPQ